MDDDKNAAQPNRARRARKTIAGSIVVAWLAMASWAYYDVETSRSEALRSANRRVTGTAEVASLLVRSEDTHIEGELARLRTELRAQGVWSKAGLAMQPRAVGGASSSAADRDGIDARRLEASLRRALKTADSFTSLELVIAGHDGLRIEAVERGEERVRTRVFDPNEREGVAKALWYSEEVAAAVASSGRRVERGEVVFEGVIERPMARAAIALHEPGDLVQGALVASVDVSGLAAQLSTLAGEGERVTLLRLDGRALDPTTRTEPDRSRLAALAGRVLDAEGPPRAFDVDGWLVLGRPLPPSADGLATTLVLVEAEVPPGGLAAWLPTPWPIALGLLAIVSIPAITGLLRAPEAQGAGSRTGTWVGVATGERETAASSAIEITPEPIVLREWLADVRGCLEREAATRGLMLDLRCERSLPADLSADPAWLGGLVVAMGREALDATESDRVALEVLEDAGDTLRFELIAGDADLAPMGGMREVAASVGGRLESERAGRMALVLPNALA